MSPALNGSSVIWRFEGSNAIEIRDGITFDFYTGLPHIYMIRNTRQHFGHEGTEMKCESQHKKFSTTVLSRTSAHGHSQLKHQKLRVGGLCDVGTTNII